MKTMKLGLALVGVALCLSGCSPYAYKQGPNDITILAKAKTQTKSITQAKQTAETTCATYGLNAELIKFNVTRGGFDKVRVYDGYMYFIDDTPASDYYTVMQVKCVKPHTS